MLVIGVRRRRAGLGGIMELLLISDSKLKVMLSDEDMKKYDIRCDDINYDSTESRKIFWQILDEAKHRTGFDAASDKVLVQLYPSRDGGCEIFVTKLGLIPPLTEKTISMSGRVSMLSSKRRLYLFDSLADLSRVCRKLEADGYARESAAYFADDKYYLILEERTNGRTNIISEYSFIEEFGRRCGNAELVYIREHGGVVKEENAVPLLARL